MKTISNTFFVTFYILFLICEVNVGQVKIKERVNISQGFKQIGRAVNTRYPMEATVTFPRTSYEFGYEPEIQIGYVLGSLSLYTPLNWGGYYTHVQDTSSFGSLSISWNPKSEATYVVNLDFTTTLGHIPPQGDYPVNLRIDLICGTVLDTTFSGFKDFAYQLVFPYPECTEPPVETDLAYFEHDNGFEGEEVCTNSNWLGITKPPQNKRINPIQHSVCFDPDRMSWRFNISQIDVNIISDLCYDNIEQQDFNLIDNISEIPESDICDALEDIIDHIPYPPNIGSRDYLLSWVIVAHEGVHVKVYKKIMDKLRPGINAIINNYRISCQEALTIQEAETRWPALDVKIKDKVREATEKWNELQTDPHEIALQAQPEVQIPIILAWGDLMRAQNSWVYCL